MRIAMVTPMSVDSAVADVMCQAVPSLASHWDLELWCPDAPELRSVGVPVRRVTSTDAAVMARLSEYDLVVSVLGDSPHHSDIARIASRVPSLLVLHDASMTNLVRRVAAEDGTLDELALQVGTIHGTEAASTLLNPEKAGPGSWLEWCAATPLDDDLLAGSLGAVVHSRWHASRIDGRTLGAVTVAPLPVPATTFGLGGGDAVTEEALRDLPGDHTLVVTLGSVNANRHIHTLLDAIARLGREDVHLWAVGPAEESARSSIVSASPIGTRLLVPGALSDRVLDAVLARANIAAALRDPVLEGQSASALTLMRSGTPLVVLDHAHYAELPDDAVVKADPTSGPEGLAALLSELLDDPERRRALGRSARGYARTRTPEAYATALLEAADRALAARVRRDLAVDLGARLRRLGLGDMPAMASTATDIAFELFDLA